jgi:predicted ester cyclase
MSVRELAEAFGMAMNSGDWEKVASFLSEDFKFMGPVPEPIGGMEWIGLSESLKRAFPDIRYNLRIDSIEGDVIRTTTQLSGTHTGDLDLTAMGFGVIPATGISFSNPEEEGDAVVRGDKVVSLHVKSVEGSGLMGILQKIGVEIPVR